MVVVGGPRAEQTQVFVIFSFFWVLQIFGEVFVDLVPEGCPNPPEGCPNPWGPGPTGPTGPTGPQRPGPNVRALTSGPPRREPCKMRTCFLIGPLQILRDCDGTPKAMWGEQVRNFLKTKFLRKFRRG